MAALIVRLHGRKQTRPPTVNAWCAYAWGECPVRATTWAPPLNLVYNGRFLSPGHPVLAPSPSLSLPSQTRAIVLLAVAGFAAQSMVRSADSLLPQIAADFAVTVGAASVIVSVYSLMHGSMQLVIGPIGDRFGKYLVIAIMCALSALTVAACGFANSLGTLTLARIGAGATASWVIPLSMAYIGDVVPYEQR